MCFIFVISFAVIFFNRNFDSGELGKDSIKLLVTTQIKKKKNFLIYKEVQKGVIATSYMTNGLLIYDKIIAHFLIY